MPVQKYKESSVHGTNHPLFVKTLSRLYYCCTVDLFPPDLCLYNKCKEFSVHGTISSVVFQNIIITTAVLWILEFGVSSQLFTGMMIEKENICIPDIT